MDAITYSSQLIVVWLTWTSTANRCSARERAELATGCIRSGRRWSTPVPPVTRRKTGAAAPRAKRGSWRPEQEPPARPVGAEG